MYLAMAGRNARCRYNTLPSSLRDFPRASADADIFKAGGLNSGGGRKTEVANYFLKKKKK
jgi:hypothetical protein